MRKDYDMLIKTNYSMDIDPEEKPLEYEPANGGFCGILRTVGVIGDSLASGTQEATYPDGRYIDDPLHAYHSHPWYDFSWGQAFARMTGNHVENFSCGGMTADDYTTMTADWFGAYDKARRCRAYIIALGVNDLYNKHGEVGTTADVCMEDYRKNAKTFAGWYAAIIQKHLELDKKARFFLVTMPKSHLDDGKDGIADAHAALMYDFAAMFPNTYVIDLRKYAPDYHGMMDKMWLGGHMSAFGYNLTAHMMVSYVDYIIRHNIPDFEQIAFATTPFEAVAKR